MNTQSRFFVLSLFVALFIYAAFSFAENTSRYANPMIKGVDNLWIDIEADYNSVVAHSLPVEQIRHKCSEKLQRAGIGVVTRDPAVSSFSGDYKIPYLIIHIDILDANVALSHIFYTRTSLSRMVSLTTESGTIQFKAEVWESKAIMESAIRQELPSVLTDAVLEQVDAFVAAWSATNTPDANSGTTRPHQATAERQSKPSDEQINEQTFVASKNSQVFHKPSCPFAQKIVSKNLVNYSSRDEAIAAGKRPCKSCNP